MEAKWRDEFKKLGRERVRYLAEIGAIAGGQRKHDAALQWLRTQERASEWREKWTLAIVIFGAAVAVAGTVIAYMGLR